MRTSSVVILLALACWAITFVDARRRPGYNINAIKNVLDNVFDIEEGRFNLFNVSVCATVPSCYGNNPESPYIQYYFPSWGQQRGRLRSDEAILVIHEQPPPCRYYGVTPYLHTRVFNSTSNFTYYASLSDTLNMNSLNIADDGTIAIVITPNRRVNFVVKASIALLLPRGSMNELPLPGELLKLGLEDDKDIFTFLTRYAFFTNRTEGDEYLADVPGYVFKLTPKNHPAQGQMFPYPEFRPYGPTTRNESTLRDSYNQLVANIQAANSAYGTATVSLGVDVMAAANYQNGFTCINNTIQCAGDNRDARYLRAPPMFLRNSSDSFVWVAGVQHQKTGKSIYTAVAASYEAKQMGVLSVSDVQMEGSADVFIPGNPDAEYLYAIKFARNCAPGEQFCFVVPVEFPGVPLSASVRLVERMYIENPYNVAPINGSFIIPSFVRYQTASP